MDPKISTTRKILIVDDEEGVRNLLLEILRDEFECLTAASAEQALELFSSNAIGLVGSDINLGGMTGVEMIPHIHRLSPDTVVMMISGDQTIDSAIEAMRQGAFDYVRKPFDIDHVLVAVRRAVTHHALLLSKREYENDLERLVRERTAQLEFLTLHDPLTDLPNRLLVEDRLGRLIFKNGDGKSVAAILLSLDRMNQIRGTLGAQAADELTVRAGARIAAVAGPNTVGRLEGDVFVILLPDTSPQAIVTFTGNLFESLAAVFQLSSGEIFLRPGIGVSIYPGDGTDAQELLRNAGFALSQARESVGPSTRFYERGVNEFAAERLAFENDLRRAMERDELLIHYQPKLETRTGRVVGAEALIRWVHPKRGLVSPGEFIPVAESIGLIGTMGEWVLQNACRDMAGLNGKGLSVSVNVSRYQLQSPGLSTSVQLALSGSGLPAELLRLEVTETSVMQNFAVSRSELQSVRESGVKVALDDFGSGYSSLNALKDLPVDILKIDRSFIADVSEDDRAAAFVKTMIDLARSLGLRVVAEGVESTDQMKTLQALECDEWQGFLFSPGVPFDQFEKLAVRG